MVQKQSKKPTSKRSKGSKQRKHRGGSLASNRVMTHVQSGCPQAEMPPTEVPSNDLSLVNLYQTTGGARKLKGGSPASEHVMKLVNKKQEGGSPASDHVMKFLDHPEHSYQNAFEGQKGGNGKSSNKNKKKKSSKKAKKSRKQNQKRGGGSSDWISTHNSRCVDGCSQDQGLFSAFTKDAEFVGAEDLFQLGNKVENPPYQQGGQQKKRKTRKQKKKSSSKSKKGKKSHSRKH